MRRRGAGLAAVMLLVSVVALAGLAVLGATPGDLQMAAMRVETARAIYAADSAAIVAVKLESENKALPGANAEVALPNSTMKFVVVPTGAVGSNRLVVLGTSGDATRRVELYFSVQ